MSTTVKVNGMTCQHCVKAVTEALRKVPGVTSVTVSLEAGQATVDGTATRETLVATVKEEGYGAE